MLPRMSETETAITMLFGVVFRMVFLMPLMRRFWGMLVVAKRTGRTMRGCTRMHTLRMYRHGTMGVGKGRNCSQQEENGQRDNG